MKAKPATQNGEKLRPAIEPDSAAGGSPHEGSETSETPTDLEDSNDLDEPDPNDADDERWDVFVLDEDDGDPLPDYGDFWFPD